VRLVRKSLSHKVRVDNPGDWIACLLLRCALIFTSRNCTIAFGCNSQLLSVHPPGRVPTIRGIFKRHWPTNPAPVAGFVFSVPACGPAVQGTSSIGVRARAEQGLPASMGRDSLR
jgi:hypothetical protein